MKMQKSAIFLKKRLEINILNLTNIKNLGTIVVIYVNVKVVYIGFVN